MSRWRITNDAMQTLDYVAIGVMVVLLTVWGVMALVAWGKLDLWPRASRQREASERGRGSANQSPESAKAHSHENAA